MTSRKKTVPWLKTLRVLAAVIFSLSAAWTAFYYFNEHRSQSSLDSLSEEMNLARIEAGVGERAVPSSLAAAETPLPPAPVPATTAASTDWHGVQAAATFGCVFPLAIAVDDPIDTLRRNAVGIVLHLNQDKLAVAAVGFVHIENGMGGRAGAGKAVEDN